MPEPSNLVWQPLNPAALTNATAPIREAGSVLSGVWDDTVKPSYEVELQLTRLMAQLVVTGSAPALPGVQDILGGVLESLLGFTNSGFHATAHHNVRRNPRYKPGEILPEGRVTDEVLESTNGLSNIFSKKLAFRPRPGSLVVSLPGGITATDDGVGRLVGTGIFIGAVNYKSRYVTLEASGVIAPGTVTASYAKQGVLTEVERQGIWPSTGTGAQGFINDLVRTFPVGLTQQSVSGVIVLGGGRAPDEFSSILTLLGLLFGKDTFVRLGASLSFSSQAIASGYVGLFDRNGGPGATAFLDGSDMGPPRWAHLMLDQLIPPIGQVTSKVEVLLRKLTPPTEVSGMQDAVLCAIEEKIAAVTAIVNKIDGAIDLLNEIAESAGANIFLLPIGEADANSPYTPYGSSPTGTISGGTTSRGAFADAVSAAVWPVDPLNLSAGYSSEPPASLRGDAFVAGAAIVATTGQISTMPALAPQSPTPTQVLSSLFGFDTVQSGASFGGVVRGLEDRPPTTTPIAPQ